MPSLHRCDGCGQEDFSAYPHEWFQVNQWGTTGRIVLIFCSEPCIRDYFNAKKLIEEIT